MKENPVIIVGFGLAGATLAWQLYFKKVPFIIIGANENTCTTAAAGLVNPIVFKKLNISWMAPTLMPYANQFYQNVEKELNQSVRRHFPIVKIFNSLEDENNWMVKKSTPQYNHYLGDVNTTSIKNVDVPFGAGTVNTIGHLDTISFLQKSKQFFIQNNYSFIEEQLEYEDIDPENRTCQSIPYSHIIFCEGWGLKKNPYFNYLPLNGTHGDTLIIKTNKYDFQKVLNKNMFIMPLGNEHFKIGATYNWTEKKPVPTVEGKQELLDRLSAFTNFKFEVISQLAGIRPTVKDRRPLLGRHPAYNNLLVFNGLGTKGVMLAPYFSNQLIEYMLENGNILAEADISRFEKYLP